MKPSERPGLEQEIDQPRSVTTPWQRNEPTEHPQRDAPPGCWQSGFRSKADRTVSVELSPRSRGTGEVVSSAEPQPRNTALRQKPAIATLDRFNTAPRLAPVGCARRPELREADDRRNHDLNFMAASFDGFSLELGKRVK